ncbi:TMhelix containing protein [Vibrio phage 1.009.O._10N.261.51.C9]|nr:TMhelix containing protein [Vibrio phage 1.009.O._10N.261.51.C9]
MKDKLLMCAAVAVRMLLGFGVCAAHMLAAYGGLYLAGDMGYASMPTFVFIVFAIGAMYGRNIVAAEKWALKILGAR